MKKTWIKWGLGTLVTGAALLFLDAWLIERYFFQLKHYKIGSHKGKKSIKLLLLTDLHFKNSVWPFYTRLAKKINKLRPDLILIAGDIIDMNGKAEPVRRFFSLVNKQLQKVAVLGNHDHKSDVDTTVLKNILETNNCTLLINESKAFWMQGEKIMVTGLDDFIEGCSNFEKAVEHIGREEHHLLLLHSPLQQETVIKKMQELNMQRKKEEQLNIRYIFAGHNHGGQIRLFSFIPVLPKKSGNYVEGWYNKQPPYLYLSKGFGTSAVPFRFGARPEITLMEYVV